MRKTTDGVLIIEEGDAIIVGGSLMTVTQTITNLDLGERPVYVTLRGHTNKIVQVTPSEDDGLGNNWFVDGAWATLVQRQDANELVYTPLMPSPDEAEFERLRECVVNRRVENCFGDGQNEDMARAGKAYFGPPVYEMTLEMCLDELGYDSIEDYEFDNDRRPKDGEEFTWFDAHGISKPCRIEDGTITTISGVAVMPINDYTHKVQIEGVWYEFNRLEDRSWGLQEEIPF